MISKFLSTFLILFCRCSTAFCFEWPSPSGHLLLPALCCFNLVPRAFPFLSLGRREKALAPAGLLCILIGQ